MASLSSAAANHHRARMASLSSAAANHHRARIASLSRDRAPDDPELIGERRSLALTKFVDHARQLVADWPDLTDEQLDRIAAILRAGR